MNDKFEPTPTSDHAETWLKAQSGNNIDPDSQAEESMPDAEAHAKTHEYRLKLEDVLSKVPDFIASSVSTYQSATIKPDDVYLPEIIFRKNGYLYRYQRAVVPEYVEDLSLERKKIEGEEIPQIPTDTSSREYKDFWDEKIFIADFADGRYSHTQYFNRQGDFQYSENANGQRGRRPIVNTPRVFSQIDQVCQELSAVNQK